MNKNKIIIQIANLLLEADENTVDWKKDKNLLNSWYILIYASLAYFLFYKILKPLLVNYLENSPLNTLIYRLSDLIFVSALTLISFYLIYRYYQFIIQTKNKIYFTNIIIFYLMSIILFSKIYAIIYSLDENYFLLNINLPKYSNTYVNHGLEGLILSAKFMVYSGMQSITGSFKGIESNSLLVSVYNYIQNLFSIGLISILVSSFVNKNDRVTER